MKRVCLMLVITTVLVLSLSGCSGKVACDSDEATAKLLAASAERFEAQLLDEYGLRFSMALNSSQSLPILIDEREIHDEHDVHALASENANRLTFERGHLVRKNYVAGELLCSAILITPSDARLPISYEVRKGDDETVDVRVRSI